ncbi:hypothetical protein HNP55_000285 [Paucibacter oligotrophus]|uniref:SWIM-type domain-containing protein n=1 Tax=Roseateles oligotrophus TaxID=1769250 RepID=A0A840L0M4_9BURK|nr:SNF2-related protein [Roseateles oligotrophus]MBB4841790.1 hypothetical protein [Roseateles oligotrophus]
MATASKKTSATSKSAPKKVAAKKTAPVKSKQPELVLEVQPTQPVLKVAAKAAAKKALSKAKPKADSKAPAAKKTKVAKPAAAAAVEAKAAPAKKVKAAAKPIVQPVEVVEPVAAKPAKAAPKAKTVAKAEPEPKLAAKPKKAAAKPVAEPAPEPAPAPKPLVKAAAKRAGAAKKAVEEASKRALSSSERVLEAAPKLAPKAAAKAEPAKPAKPAKPVQKVKTGKALEAAASAVPAPLEAQPAKAKPSPAPSKSAKKTAPAPAAPQAKPAPVPAPAPAAPVEPPRFRLQAQNAGSVLGEYRVSEIEAAGQSWRVQVQGALAMDCRCDCAAFPRSDRGSCEHVDFALAQLLSQPVTAEALRAGPQADYSEVLLRFGARRQLRWRQGRACPPALAEAAQALLDESGRLRAEAPGALAQLLQLAAAAGHELRVEEGVWPLLAHKRDAGQRVLRLEQNYPQGLATPALRNLLKLPLPIFQLEAALFAVSAGRSLLADELGLGLYAQALGASELLMRHFGVERVLLLCAESAQSRWLAEAQTLSGRAAQLVWGDAAARAEQLADGSAQIKICASSALAQDLSQLQAFAPELIIVDEAGRLDGQALAALKALEAARPEQGFLLLLSGQLLNSQPKVLLPLVDLLDSQRSGPYARLLSHHVRRDAAGQIQGFVGLDALDQTLERLMLSRSKADLAAVLPPALVQLRGVALGEAQQALQLPLLRELRRGVQRWERSGYVSDAEQLALARAVQSLRRLAISPQLLAPAAAELPADAPKLAAVAAVARELLGVAAQRLVVFCQWDDALSLLARRLQSQGFELLQLSADQGLAERQALAGRWREDERVQVLLISDAAATGLQLISEGADAGLGLINLELPWSEELLARRLSAMCEEDTRGLPLIQLQAQQGLEQAMLQAMDVLPELPLCSLDGDASQRLLQGEALTAWMQSLALLCSLLPE